MNFACLLFLMTSRGTDAHSAFDDDDDDDAQITNICMYVAKYLNIQKQYNIYFTTSNLNNLRIESRVLHQRIAVSRGNIFRAEPNPEIARVGGRAGGALAQRRSREFLTRKTVHVLASWAL